MLQRILFEIKLTGICLKILWSRHLFIKQKISEVLLNSDVLNICIPILVRIEKYNFTKLSLRKQTKLAENVCAQ